MSLIEYPFELPGRIFGSSMPFGLYDPEGKNFQSFRQQEVSVVVVLAEGDECAQKSGRDLLAFYALEGLQVVHLPIANYGVPGSSELQDTLRATIEHARSGRNIAVHCSAGLGRTGFFMAWIVKREIGLNGREAIRWVGRHNPEVLLTPAQIEMILGC